MRSSAPCVLPAGGMRTAPFQPALLSSRSRTTLRTACHATKSRVPVSTSTAAKAAAAVTPAAMMAAAGQAAAMVGPTSAQLDAAEQAHSTAAAMMVASTSGQELFAIADAAAATTQRAGGWLTPLVETLETVLKALQGGLDQAHVPYSYGFSIILLTAIVKVVTFPLTKQQVESSLAVQALKPRIDLIKARFGEDKDKIQKETSILYEQAGVNPLAGCLPTLATIPIFIGLFNSLTNVANDGLLENQGFFWVPSLAGPTSMADRAAGFGMSWLTPFVDGAPPIGWDDGLRYLSLPVLLVLTQFASSAIISPPPDPEDPNANTQRALLIFLPLMVGYFSLNVPAGLSLYYLSNSVLTTLVQVYLKKLGGATVTINELGPVTKPGSGRRTGAPVADVMAWVPTTVDLDPKPVDEEAAAEAAAAAAAAASAAALEAAAQPIDPSAVDRRVKRRRMSLIQAAAEAGASVAASSNGSSNGSSGGSHLVPVAHAPQ